MKYFYLLVLIYCFCSPIKMSAQTIIEPVIGINIHKVENYEYVDLYIIDQSFKPKSFLFGLNIEQYLAKALSIKINGSFLSQTEVNGYILGFNGSYKGIGFKQRKIGITTKFYIKNFGIGIGANYVQTYDINKIYPNSPAKEFFIKDRGNVEVVSELSYMFKNIELALFYQYGMSYPLEAHRRLRFKPLQTISLTLGYRFEILKRREKKKGKNVDCPTF